MLQGVSNAFFIDGPGGTGKTFLENALLAAVCARGKIAVVVASTALAATLLPGGTTVVVTAHSRFGIPIPVNEDSISRYVLHLVCLFHCKCWRRTGQHILQTNMCLRLYNCAYCAYFSTLMRYHCFMHVQSVGSGMSGVT